MIFIGKYHQKLWQRFLVRCNTCKATWELIRMEYVYFQFQNKYSRVFVG